MIRCATADVIAAMVTLTGELHHAARIPGSCEPDVVAGTLAALIQHGLVLVVDVDGIVGFLAAERARTSVSRQWVAVEHGWYCRTPGWGLRLLSAYEAWARDSGCSLSRLSSPAGDERVAGILARSGYAAVETAWVKGL